MITPAIVNRVAHMSAGGMCSTAMSMARYVDPQNRYTRPKLKASRKRDGLALYMICTHFRRLQRGTRFRIVGSKNRHSARDARRASCFGPREEVSGSHGDYDALWGKVTPKPPAK